MQRFVASRWHTHTWETGMTRTVMAALVLCVVGMAVAAHGEEAAYPRGAGDLMPDGRSMLDSVATEFDISGWGPLSAEEIANAHPCALKASQYLIVAICAGAKRIDTGIRMDP